MMAPFCLHLFLVFLGMAFLPYRGIFAFILGFIISFLLLIPFAKVLGREAYIKKIISAADLLRLFLKAFLHSNLSVAYVILFVRKNTLKPQFFDYPLENLTLLEAILLSYCITLTPGTLSVNLDRNRNSLVVHSLGQHGIETVMEGIHAFKESIVRFTRC